jgi:G6PDH family F420-dependent oxidoreductase
MLEGRFFLGVGTGENLNEHIVGQRWPATHVRQEMLEEAIEGIRLLWKGGLQSHRGRHYIVETARIYSRPSTPPPIMFAVGGPKGAERAGRIGDGMVGTDPRADSIKAFERAGGRRKPRYGELTVYWTAPLPFQRGCRRVPPTLSTIRRRPPHRSVRPGEARARARTP